MVWVCWVGGAAVSLVIVLNFCVFPPVAAYFVFVCVFVFVGTGASLYR